MIDRRAASAPAGLVLGLAVLCVSSAAVLVRWCRSDAEAVAFWRLALAALALWVVAAPDRARRAAALRVFASPWTLAAGAFLAAHFWLWIRSLSETSVAASTLLLAVQLPVAGLVSWLALREPPGPRGVAGLALGLVGVALLWALDRTAHGPASGAARGDLFAIASGVTYVGYAGIGRRVRQRVPILPYLAGVNTWAALAVAGCALLAGGSLAPAEPRDWAPLALLALVPTLGGHGLVNLSLAWVRVHVVNLAVMAEPVGASVLAWLLLGEAPPWTACLAAPAILGGAVLALGEIAPAPSPSRVEPDAKDVDDED